ncbi:hypothetical protein ACFVQF_17430 [Streptomyces sp. NPDC057866]
MRDTMSDDTSVRDRDQPLHEHTLMPTHMRGASPAELVPPLAFTNNVPLLKLPGHTLPNPYAFGTHLFVLHTDADQAPPGRQPRTAHGHPAHHTAPRRRHSPEQYERLNLPPAGPFTERLLACAQKARADAAHQLHRAPRTSPAGPLSAHALVAQPALSLSRLRIADLTVGLRFTDRLHGVSLRSRPVACRGELGRRF